MKNNYQRKVKKELIPTCNIMGVNIAAINMEWLLNYLDKNLSEIKGDYICVSNVHTTVTSYENPYYCAIQNDGLRLSYGGVIKLSKIRPRFEIIDWNSPKSEKCDTFNANCVILPWHIFKKLDNIDPIYSHSLGDFDYGFQASNRGIQIKMYDAFVGVCCDNPITGSWRDVTLSKRERIAKKESAKGLPFFEWFHYLNKNYSLPTAIIYSITPYIRIFLKK